MFILLLYPSVALVGWDLSWFPNQNIQYFFTAQYMKTSSTHPKRDQNSNFSPWPWCGCPVGSDSHALKAVKNICETTGSENSKNKDSILVVVKIFFSFSRLPTFLPSLAFSKLPTFLLSSPWGCWLDLGACST